MTLHVCIDFTVFALMTSQNSTPFLRKQREVGQKKKKTKSVICSIFSLSLSSSCNPAWQDEKRQIIYLLRRKSRDVTQMVEYRNRCMIWPDPWFLGEGDKLQRCNRMLQRCWLVYCISLWEPEENDNNTFSKIISARYFHT